jgi:cytochrome P450
LFYSLITIKMTLEIAEAITRDSLPKSEFNPLESDEPEHLYSVYNTLRSKCPLAYTHEYAGYWQLTKHADVKAAAMDSATFISSVKAVVPSDPRGLRRPPLNFDAPAHTPYRTALDRTLKPNRLKRLQAPLEKHAQAELAPMLEEGGGDICAHFAARFPAWVETEWLNLDQSLAPVLAKTAASWVNAWRAMDKENVGKYSEELYGIAKNLLANRRAEPRDPEEDPASSLLLEKDSDGKPLDEVHLIGALRQSLVVGMVAPPLLIGAICNHLSNDKELQDRLRQNPDLIPAAVEEFVRLYTPYRGFCRTTSKEVTLHGRTIRPGEPVTLTYSAANRDPDVFPNPDEFVLNRENITAHLGFGKGKHRCVGMPLARMAIQIALRTLLASTKNFEVNGPLAYSKMPELGIKSCPLKMELRI